MFFRHCFEYIYPDSGCQGWAVHNKYPSKVMTVFLSLRTLFGFLVPVLCYLFLAQISSKFMVKSYQPEKVGHSLAIACLD
jgi:hypothetical protein